MSRYTVLLPQTKDRYFSQYSRPFETDAHSQFPLLITRTTSTIEIKQGVCSVHLVWMIAPKMHSSKIHARCDWADSAKSCLASLTFRVSNFAHNQKLQSRAEDTSQPPSIQLT